eukprot:11758531-Alexandrium_andersonii.AAC.1
MRTGRRHTRERRPRHAGAHAWAFLTMALRCVCVASAVAVECKDVQRARLCNMLWYSTVCCAVRLGVPRLGTQVWT